MASRRSKPFSRIPLIVLKKYSTKLLRSYAHPRLHKRENLERFLRTWGSARLTDPV